MEHINTWSMLMMLIYWAKTNAIKSTEGLLEVRREVSLEANKEKTKYMVMSHHQYVGQNHNLLIANKSFEKWQSSSTWEQQTQIKTAFTKKLRADYIQESLYIGIFWCEI
jgi:hypothetical protein